jgi:hypothetical protein
MGQYMFRALVTLDAAAREVPAGGYPSGTHHVMVHARRPGRPGGERYFEAVITRDDGQPLRRGEEAVATIAVPDEDAEAFLAEGERFTLWHGSDIGHGVVSRRVFTPGSPS